ncbi:MAG: NTPase [Candidatus Caldarchaeales archaeon]
MKLLYALTGPPRSGKTTAVIKIKELLESAKVKVDGMFTEEIKVSGDRLGFTVTRIATGEKGIMAHVDIKSIHRIGRYGVDMKVLEEVGVRGIIEGIDNSEFLIIDEVGPMELLSDKFIVAVKRVLSHQVPTVVTVHYRASHPLVHEVKRSAGGRLITVTEHNRDKIPYKIVEEVLGILR